MVKFNKRNIDDILALTPMQEGMLFHYLTEPGSDLYFEQLSLEISGEIDVKIFEKAWNLVTESNEMLRAVFQWETSGNPVQIILKEHECKVTFYDLSGKEGSRKKSALAEIKAKDRSKGFDLNQVPFRVTLCKIAGKKYQMVISNHHILYDGWSTGIILREFFDVYYALSSGNQSVALPGKPLFKEFIQWLRNLDKTDQQRFWKEYLAGFENPTVLPLKIRRKEAGEIKGSDSCMVILKRSVRDRLEIFIKEHRVTLASFFYSTWGILLQRYCNTEEVIFGTTVSGRSTPIKGIRDMVGLFINTIPLRIKTGIGEKVKDLLCRVNDDLQVREKYEITPLVDIKECTRLESSADLFDSLVVMENYPLDHHLMRKNSQLPLVVDSYSIVESINYDLSICITVGEVIGINFIYNPISLEESSISRLSSHFNNIIEHVLKNSTGEIPGIEMLSEEEKKQLLYDFNNTAVEYPPGTTLLQLFTGQVESTPDNIAVVGTRQLDQLHQKHEKEKEKGTGRPGGRRTRPIKENISITYGELNEKANQLGWLLKQKGVQADTIAAIMMDRSLEMIIGILAILKAGGVYLPIDADYPEERIAYMLNDSSAKILVTSREKVEKWDSVKGKIIQGRLSIVFYQRENGTGNRITSSPPWRRLSPWVNAPAACLAYIIYTSGTTGRPKGVTIEHQAVVNLLWALKEKYPFTISDVYLFKTSFLFDVSITEIFGWFMEGGKLAVLEKGEEKEPWKIAEAVERWQVTHINFVPSMFNLFVDCLNPQKINKISSLKYIFLAGEELQTQLVCKFRALDVYPGHKAQLENLYGPTEAAVYASTYSLSGWQEKSRIPIGKPLNNVKLYILDRYNNLQAIGIPGELCISGAGLARGYLNRVELTRGKFFSFFDNKSYRTYRSYISKKNYKTSDLARWFADGNIEFLGRMDHQVKIRGFRIELGEIENQLLSHSRVKEAVVVTKSALSPGEQYLCAYIVTRQHIDNTELREYLSRALPDYMIPSHFVEMEKLALTPSGKLDRKSLPEPVLEAGPGYMAPRDEVEKKLAGIWADLLGIDRDREHDVIGIDDNFFALGGHSLKATIMVSRIYKTFNVRLPLGVLFKNPSIRRLSNYIQTTAADQLKTGAAVEEKEYILPGDVPMKRLEKKEYYPLSSAQRRLYVLWEIDRGVIAYNMPSVWLVRGEIDKNRLENTFKKLIQRHESLRVSFTVIDDEPVQKVHDEVPFEIEYYDPQVTGAGDRCGCEEAPGGQAPDASTGINRTGIGGHHSFVRPFDLSNVPLLRIGLFDSPPAPSSQEGREREYLLMVDMHHMIVDGLSLNLLVKDFVRLYAGENLPGPAPVYTYKDYAARQQSSAYREKLQQQKIAWLKEFVGEIPVLHLPLDYPRPVVQCFAGKEFHFTVSAQQTRDLRALFLDTGVTLFMLLFSLYTVLLSKLSSQEDIIVGTPVAGRRDPELEHIVGMFVNTLALRNFPMGEKPFSQFLKEVKETTIKAFENQDYPYGELVESLAVNRDAARNPLFDAMFIFQDLDLPVIDIPGLHIKLDQCERRTSKFDLTLECREQEDSLSFIFEYSTALFTPGTIVRFSRYFTNIIASVIGDREQKISAIDILPEAEKRQLVMDFNDTAEPFPRDKTIDQLMEEQAERFPHRLALLGPELQITNYKTVAITYKELKRRSGQLAHYLFFEKGIRPGEAAAILMERSTDLIISLIGVMKSGGAYVPLDPSLPVGRLRRVFNDASIGVVISQRKFSRELSQLQTRCRGVHAVLSMDDPVSSIYSQPAGGPHLGGASHPAYIMYTSGSSGTPKGVVVEHRTIVNTLIWRKNYYDYQPGDVSLRNPPYFFDSSVTDIFTPLLGGAQLVLVSEEEKTDLEALGRVILFNNVSHFIAVPAFYNIMVEEIPHALVHVKRITVAGEHFPDELIKKHFKRLPHVRIFNEYGPTENSVNTTAYELKPGSQKAFIGKPISNVAVYLLDGNLYLSPMGASGEICLAGSSLARGYLNDPELTAQKFLTRFYRSYTSYTSYISKRIYKTGDLGRWRPDGNLEFLGRIDTQIKIRGIRIEVGEIENHLMKREDVKEAMVLAREDSIHGGERYLCAYLVPSGRKAAAEVETDFREYLAHRLPEYMIPAYFLEIDAIPFTPAGKINRGAFPAPGGFDEDFIMPRNEIEEKLAGIYAGVLGKKRETMGIDVDFFRLGGHSLKATIAVSRIHKVFNVKVPLTEIFVRPTIRELAKYIENAGIERFAAIEPVDKKEFYPLSPAQERLFVLQQIGEAGPGTAYNLPTMSILEGNIDKSRLERTFRLLIQRHESLRTSFHMIGDEPVQVIHESVEFGLEYYNTGQVEVDFIRPFDPGQAPLLRVGLAQLEAKEHLLMVDMHHIISDGTSAGILVKEFMAIYEGRDLPGLRLRYRDYAGWQNRRPRGAQENFWLEEFGGEVPVLELPTDYLRPRIQDFAGSTLSFELDGEVVRVLKTIAREQEATLFMVLLTLYNIFLAKISGQEVMVVGTPAAGRLHTDLEQLIGMFVNTLALKNEPSGEKNVKEFLREVKEKTLNAFANQDYQYEELVEKVGVKRDTGRNPLFDTMFIMQNLDIPELRIPGLSLTAYEYERRVSKFDLSMLVEEAGAGLLFTMEYCTKLFKEETIRRFSGVFQEIMAQVIAAPGQRISSIQLLAVEDKQRLLSAFNNTGADYPRDKTFYEIFREQVQLTPGHTALIGQSLERRASSENEKTFAPGASGWAITYRELNERSRRLAYLLREKGVGPGIIVGIMVGRFIEMIIGILAILKASGAYLPIDPEYPEERIEFMVKDSGVEILLKDNDITPQVFNSRLKCAPSHLHQPPPAPATSLAYVIYTSGSTGKPKGVMIENWSLVNFIKGITDIIAFREEDTILSLTTISFDIFGLETLLPLSKGTRVVVGNRKEQIDPEAAGREMERQCITIFQATPSRLQILLSSGKASRALKRLKYLLVGGEALPGVLLREVSKITASRIYNLYGPTETTIYSAVREVTGKNVIDIGKPIANTRIYILDPYDSIVPPGIPGELSIGGDGLARGYLNRPGLTNEKFRPLFPGFNRFYMSHMSHMSYIYFTGDLARWLPDGNIEFLGRIDHQVKVRGYRIEPGEIENRLLKHHLITEAVVIPREGALGEKYLCAYLVSGETLDIKELRQFLAGSLPDYMIPSYFTRVEEIPLNRSGKVDRKALPLPDIKAGDNYEAPRDNIQLKLLRIWSEVLGVAFSFIGIDDNFFEKGGQSLKAAVMAARVYKIFDIHLPLAEIFKTPDIRRLAQYIRGAAPGKFTAIEPAEIKSRYVVSSGQRRLYVLQQLDEQAVGYNMPFILTAAGQIDKDRFENAFKRLIARHESLRTSFHTINGEPVQVVHHEVEFKILYHEVNETHQQHQQSKAFTGGPGGRFSRKEPPWSPKAIFNSFIRPFDLSRAPLLRVGLSELPPTPSALRSHPSREGRSILMIDMHHIISDGASLEVLVEEFLALYEGRQLPRVKLQYKDYAEWQSREIKKDAVKQQEAYWLEQFAGEVPVLNLPLDFDRAAGQTFTGSTVRLELGPRETAALNRLARDEQASLYMVLIALMNIFLSKITGQQDIVIGTVEAGRNHPDLEKIIGMFVNTLALRNYPSPGKIFSEFLQEVKIRILEAFENRDYPLEELVERLAGSGNNKRNSLFDVVFALNEIGPRVLETPGLRLTPVKMEHDSAKFDIAIVAYTSGETLIIEMEYRTKLFTRETIQQLARCFKDVTAAVLENKDIRLQEISVSHDLMAAKEIQLEKTFNF